MRKYLLAAMALPLLLLTSCEKTGEIETWEPYSVEFTVKPDDWSGNSGAFNYIADIPQLSRKAVDDGNPAAYIYNEGTKNYEPLSRTYSDATLAVGFEVGRVEIGFIANDPISPDDLPPINFRVQFFRPTSTKVTVDKR